VARYFPRHLNIETSDHCNRSCAFCPIQHARDRAPPRLLDDALYDRLLAEVGRAGLPMKISLQWVDEPLSNPRFFDYVDRGRALAPEARWLLQTNGDLLDEERLEQLKPRFDAVCVNVYSESAHRRLTRLGLDYRAARWPDRLQSPGRLSPAAGQEGREGEAIVHINEKFHDEGWVQWHDEVTAPIDAPCTRLWEQASIAWDGTVYLCCRDNEREHPVGNLAEGSLFDIFNSDESKALREEMEAGRRDRIAMCHKCDKRFVAPFDALDDDEVGRLGGEGTQTVSGALQARRARREDASHLPWGRWEYFGAREAAKALGHVALPGYLPLRYEYVVGVTPALARGIVEACREVAGAALLGVLVCGGRVMTRQRLALVDPSVFLAPVGPLRVGKKDRLRELGRNPRYASDLDVKVLVDEDALDAVEAQRRGPALGERLEALHAPLPISGHIKPLVRLLRVPSSCADAREGFARYNERRVELLGKGPLSLEYTQLLWDRAEPRDVTAHDATAPVRAQLLGPDVDGLSSVPLHELEAAEGVEGVEKELLTAPESRLYRVEPDPLSYHQLLCALIDFPEHDPPVVIDDGGRLAAGALGVRAARRAGRTHVRVARGQGRAAP
jgi:radical SAM protein with 4Fe4S-binding SPASM domain